MPDITILGWFHTGVGAFSLLIGLVTIAKHKIIRQDTRTGKIYLIATIVTALSALGIYNQGGFNIAHVLAIMTLLAVLVGGVAEKTTVFAQFSPYMQAASYSATFLFHSIPAITDGLRRLPLEDPVVQQVDDPLLLGFYGAFVVVYLIGFGLQALWISKQSPRQH